MGREWKRGGVVIFGLLYEEVLVRRVCLLGESSLYGFLEVAEDASLR